MSYDYNVDIKVKMDEILEKLLDDKSYIEFRLKHNKYIERPYHDAMREEFKEDEMWSDLQELDYSNRYPPLHWKSDNIGLIMEVINAVEEGYLEFDRTQLHMSGHTETWYISGHNDDFRIKTIYKSSTNSKKEE